MDEQKKLARKKFRASSVLLYMLRQLSTDSSDDDGGGGNNGVRCSMTSQNSSRSMDMAGSNHMDNNRSRTDNNHIGKLDNQIRLRLPLYLPRPERQNAGRAQEVIQLPPMQ
jgi:hypothetical protein